ncbi:MAG: DUF2846 domain-containing protein [Proteobacteria bacterium]|nr:DUF2846 domain-containing protein [Pseudomonadota bacterium]
MFKGLLLAGVLASSMMFAGCASVPMAAKEQDAAAKTFAAPASDKAGIYIFRDSQFGAALKKLVSLDGNPLFQSASKTYFYKEIAPGKHTVTTESEFGDNSVEFVAEGGKLHYFRNYIKMGLLVGGANLEAVAEEEGRNGVNECSLAAPLTK